ncbi:MAG: dephospho-CoA kinase [Thermodesulfobacteriota bacterium]
MKVLGLTGNIASGKSTVASMLEQLGAKVIDVDDIAKKIVEPGQQTWKQIVTTFGNQILNADETINRKLLGDIIFNDELKRNKLNEITHPVIIKTARQKVEEYKSQNVRVVIIEAALIVEKGGLKDLIEKLIVVTSDKQDQIDRLSNRDGFSENDALSRINSQIPHKEKAKHADYLIDNSQTIEHTLAQVNKLWEEIRN